MLSAPRGENLPQWGLFAPPGRAGRAGGGAARRRCLPAANLFEVPEHSRLAAASPALRLTAASPGLRLTAAPPAPRLAAAARDGRGLPGHGQRPEPSGPPRGTQRPEKPAAPGSASRPPRRPASRGPGPLPARLGSRPPGGTLRGLRPSRHPEAARAVPRLYPTSGAARQPEPPPAPRNAKHPRPTASAAPGSASRPPEAPRKPGPRPPGDTLRGPRPSRHPEVARTARRASPLPARPGPLPGAWQGSPKPGGPAAWGHVDEVPQAVGARPGDPAAWGHARRSAKTEMLTRGAASATWTCTAR
jgi:hypothetical protein